MVTTLALILAGAALAQVPDDRTLPADEKPFVLERKGRRDPFVDPRTPRVEPLPPVPDDPPPTLTTDVGEEPLEQPLPDQASDALGMARAIVERIDQAFVDPVLRPHQRAVEIEAWVGRLRRVREGATPASADGVQGLLHVAERTLVRARIRAEFEDKKPAITGVLYSLEEATRRHRLGLDLFGRDVRLEAAIPVPNSKSSVILRFQGSLTGDRACVEGEALDEAGTMQVSRIEKNQIAFLYRQETIWVPTAR